MPGTITITIRISGDGIEDPGPIGCSPEDTVVWTGDGVGRWIVGFTDAVPFAGGKRFFSGEGQQTDQAKAKNAPGDYKYWIFCEKPGAGGDAFYSDPILTVHVASATVSSVELRALADDLSAIRSQMSELDEKADMLQAESIELARQMEQSSEAAG